MSSRQLSWLYYLLSTSFLHFSVESNKAEREENHSYEQNVIKQLRQSLFSVDVQYRELMLFELLLNKNLCSKFVHDNSFVTSLC